jgi:LacI family transcriptional regulator
MQSDKRITHLHIAEKLGISRGAVTQALHGSRNSTLSLELQQKIMDTARELNYRPRVMANHAIGLIGAMENLTLSGEAAFLSYLDEALKHEGYRLLLANVSSNGVNSLCSLTPKNVEGVIYQRWFGGEIAGMLSSDIPAVVTSDEDGIPGDVDLVTMDTHTTVERLTRYLLSYGHTRFCLVTGIGDRHFHGHIKAGMQSTLSSVGLSERNLKIIEVAHHRLVADSFPAIMRAPDAPTAIVASSNENTLAVVHQLYAAGYKVPEDVSLVSLADGHFLESIVPAVTATTADGREVAIQATHRLLEKIGNPDSKPRQVRIAGDIIERGSVGPVKERSRSRSRQS